MANGSWQDGESRTVLPVQVIVAALVAGCLFFLAVVLVIRPEPKPAGGDQQPIITWVALGMAGLAVLARVIVPGQVVAFGRRAIVRRAGAALAKASPAPLEDPAYGRELAARLAFVYTARTMMACAVLEGAAFLLLIAYLVEGQVWSLAGAVVLIIVLGGHFPTRSAVLQWIESQAQLIDEEVQTENR